MSRIGNAIITIPNGVTVSVDASNVVTVKGPKGELTEQVNEDIKVVIEENELRVERPSEAKEHKAMHGLYRALINNMVVGVSEGFKKELEFVGVGYRAAASGQKLEMSLGYSHPIVLMVAPEITVTSVSEKGKNPIVTLESHDKHLVGQVAAKIRSLRKPEPYKGKGVRFKGEQIRRKEGKTSAK